MAEYQACDFSEKTDLLPPGASSDAADPKFHVMNREPSPCDTCDYYASYKCQECGYFGTCVHSIAG